MLSPQALALDLAASIDSSLNSASAACAARTLLPSGVVLRCGLSCPPLLTRCTRAQLTQVADSRARPCRQLPALMQK